MVLRNGTGKKATGNETATNNVFHGMSF